MSETIGTVALPNNHDHESIAKWIASRLLLRHKEGVLDSYFALREACASDEWREALVLFLEGHDDQSS